MKVCVIVLSYQRMSFELEPEHYLTFYSFLNLDEYNLLQVQN